MSLRILRIILPVVLSWGYAEFTFADIVTGNISAPNVTWTASGNPWIIRAPDINNPIEEITIGAGTTLTIEPGVIVQVDGAISIRILGTLIARGTSLNPITFRSFDPNLKWRYLEFDSASAPAVFSGNTYQSGSILEYVNFISAGSKSYGNAYAKAAVYLNGGRPYITNVSITNSISSGIYIENINNVLKINATTISNNHDTSASAPVTPGYQGGGITIADQLAGASIEISLCNISGNSTQADGGGILVSGNVDNLVISQNTISDNLSANNGGGIFFSNLTGLAANYQIDQNIIRDNIAEFRGGGITVENSNLTVYNNQILGNMTNQLDGGGVFLSVNANVDLDTNIIANNTSALTGGGIYVGLGSYFGPIAGNNINITHNIISGNDAATRGGGLYVEEDTLTITDNIFSDNTAGVTSAALQVEAGGTLARNTITRHSSNVIVVIDDAQQSGNTPMTMQHNAVVYNNAAIDVILNASGSAAIPAMQAIVTENNIFSNGNGFYIENSVVGAGDMTAENNWFATTDPLVLQAYTSGLVDYNPFALAIIEEPVPISPPANVSVSRSGSNATVSWSASPESDIAGYTVYYGTVQGPVYQMSTNAGFTTSLTVSGLNAGNNYYFAVTAYDSLAATVVDDPATTINERQVSTHESAFSMERAAVVSSGSGGGGGGSMGWMLAVYLALFIYRKRAFNAIRFA